VAEARRPLPVVEAALAEARGAIADGRGGDDYSALAAWIEDAG
jgi:hypothetical protein